jgi:hypothetical protein
MEMRAGRFAIRVAVTAAFLLMAACGKQQTENPPESDAEPGSQPEMTTSAPTDSTYEGAAGRKEEGTAATESASGEPPAETPPPPDR